MAPPVLYRVIYGTPEPEAWQSARLTIRSAILHDYRRQRVMHADYPAIVPKPLATVRGAFITGLSDMDVRRLDLFEGSMYERRKVTVKLLRNVRLQENVPDSNLASVEGDEVEAETYVWRDPVGHLEDREWDFENFRKTKMKEWAGLPGSTGAEVDEGFAFVDEYCAAAPRSGSTGGPRTGRHGSGGRGTAGRGMSARGDARQGTDSRGIRGQGTDNRGTRGRCTDSRGTRGQGPASRGTRGQGTDSRGMKGWAIGGRGGGDQDTGDRGIGSQDVRDRGGGSDQGRGTGGTA
jgi:hypothetical protein